VAIAVIFLSACASDKLALAPAAGVDLTGHWKLNEADSDDPQRNSMPPRIPRTPREGLEEAVVAVAEAAVPVGAVAARAAGVAASAVRAVPELQSCRR
jgi:hypothetical protein